MSPIARKLSLVLAALAAVLLAVVMMTSGCDGSRSEQKPEGGNPAASGAPTVQQFLAQAVAAAKKQDGVRIRMQGDLNIKIADREVTRMLRVPWHLTADGVVSSAGAKINARLALRDKRGPFRFVADRERGFARWDAQWFGPFPGVTAFAGLTGHHIARNIEGKVTAGPKLSGVETWKLTAHVTDEVVARAMLGARVSDLPPGRGRDDLKSVARHVRIAVYASRDDMLVRRITIRFGGHEWDADSRGDVQDLTVAVRVDLADWGSAVKSTLRLPDQARPADKVFDEILG